jgi:hypothetical protein
LLAPWPGSLGYLSGLQVYDLLGRATPIPGEDAHRAWTGAARGDVVAALEREPDFVVATLRRPPAIPSPHEVAEAWLAPWDARPDRVDEIERALDAYELVAVPISVGYRWGSQGEAVQLLLRRTALELSPRLRLSLADDGGVAVDVEHRGHPQLANLRVEIRDENGGAWALRPTGVPEREDAVYARTELLLYASGTRSIRLMVAPIDTLPEGARPIEVRARLDNPGATGDHRFAAISAEATLRL